MEAANLANNHSMDYFQPGFDDTVSHLKKAGIACFGDEQTVVAGKVGLIGANALGPVEQGVGRKALQNTLKAQIKTLKKQVPVVIVYFHWGTETTPQSIKCKKTWPILPLTRRRPGRREPSPCLTAVEQYKGKTIVYSLVILSSGKHQANLP